MSKQKITPNLWFDGQAEEAVRFYVSCFEDGRIGNVSRYGKEGQEKHGKPEGEVMTMEFELFGRGFTALNGGPQFKINPSINFFVRCDTKEEVNKLWNQLIAGGEAMMPLDKYEWSEYYGWLNDRFGASWQIMLDDPENVQHKISPLFFFTGDVQGKAKEAHDFYLNVFKNSSSEGVARYEAPGEKIDGMVMHSQFLLEGQTFMAMDSGVENDFPFNEAVSLIIHCDNQDEVDYYWSRLLENGGVEQQCGWLKDQFGVSWQIIPRELSRLMSDPDKERAGRAMNAMLKMIKLDIEELKRAAEKAS